MPAGFRKIAKRLLRGPRSLALGLWNYGYDFARFTAATSFMRVDPDRGQLGARILKEFHSLEKGLSLPQPRPGFGRDKADAVMAMTAAYERGGRAARCAPISASRPPMDSRCRTSSGSSTPRPATPRALPG